MKNEFLLAINDVIIFYITKTYRGIPGETNKQTKTSLAEEVTRP